MHKLHNANALQRTTIANYWAQEKPVEPIHSQSNRLLFSEHRPQSMPQLQLFIEPRIHLVDLQLLDYRLVTSLDNLRSHSEIMERALTAS